MSSRVRLGIALAALLTALSAPWPFASVEPFWATTFAALVLAAASASALTAALWPATGPLPRAALVLACSLVAVPLLGVVPLPAGVVRALLPAGARLFESVGAHGDAPRGLSLYAPATWDALTLSAACAALALLVAGQACTPKRARILAWVLVGGGAAIAAFGLVQRLVEPDHQRMFWSVRLSEVTTPFGPYVNRNHFGGAMLLFGGVAAGLLLDAHARRRPRARAVAALALLVCGVALAGCASRGALVGAATAAALLVGATSGQRRVRAAVAVLLGVGLVTGALAATGLLDDLLRRFTHVQGRWENRFLVQADALRVWRAFPWMGTGAGTFAAVYPAFQSIDGTRHFEDAHSDWVQFLMETGVLGAACAAAVLLHVGGAVRAAWRRPGAGSALALGAAAGCAGLAAHGCFETNLHIPANALLAAATLGLAYGAALGASRPAAGSDGAVPSAMSGGAAAAAPDSEGSVA